MRTVFHVSSPGALGVAPAKVENLLADESVDLDRVSVVIDDGETIARLRDDHDIAESLAALPESVDIEVCQNALAGAAVDAEALPDVVDVVPSGVGELTRLQSEGFAYINIAK